MVWIGVFCVWIGVFCVWIGVLCYWICSYGVYVLFMVYILYSIWFFFFSAPLDCSAPCGLWSLYVEQLSHTKKRQGRFCPCLFLVAVLLCCGVYFFNSSWILSCNLSWSMISFWYFFNNLLYFFTVWTVSRVWLFCIVLGFKM